MIFVFWGTLAIIIMGGYFLTRTVREPVQKESHPMAQGIEETASTYEDQTFFQEEITKLTLLANTDNLTGLYNHRYFLCQLDQMLAESIKTGRPISLVLFDFNDFTYCNYIFSRLEGDTLFRKAAGRIKQMTPQSGIAARYGGDEIVLLLPGYDTNKAVKLVQNMTQEVEASFSGEEKLSLAAGISCYPETVLDKQALINYAYQELYRAKEINLNKLSSYHLVLQSIKKEEAASQELMTLAKFFLLTINLKDHYTLSHTNLVVKYAQGLGRALSLSQEEINKIKISALFHDVGKIQIPEQLLMKIGALTESEWHQIRQHPLWSGELLSVLIENEYIISMVKHHHERFDGKGYPDGLAGEQIPLGARIIALADSFSAMTAERPYREAFTIPQALKEVKKNAGTQFDPEISDTFIRIIHQLL